MDTVFPFGFPVPTAFYLTMYVLTFVLHQAFMHYVLAGSLYVAWATVWRGRDSVSLTEQPLAATLRDWMPFLLSAAITAGVAPLLFIQIVYQHQFYTANLLLWWRWVVVVPVLIVAFYLLYLVKSRMLWNWPYAVRVAIAVGTSISFVFVGLCFTVNHLLANSSANWPDVYTSGRLPFSATPVVLRMLIWIGGSFASMTVIVGWQLRYRQTSLEQGLAVVGTRSLARMSVGGIAIALVAGTAYILQCDAPSRSLVFGGIALPYVLLTAVGAMAQLIGWSLQWRSGRLSGIGLTASTAGASLSLLSVSVIREVLRVRAIDLASLSQRHADAATVGGFGVFLVAAVIVTLLIAWCVRLVQTGMND